MATREELDKVYQEELGRGVDSSGASTYSDMSADQVRKELKKSEEYKGKSSSSQSPYISSDAELSTKEQEYYDVWTEEMGSKPLLQTELDNWVKYGASPDHWRADLKGLITYQNKYNDKGKLTQPMAIYSQGALDLIGADGMKKIGGQAKGSIILVPKGTQVGKYWAANKNNTLDGAQFGMQGEYQWFQATGTPGTGGITNIIADKTGLKVDELVQKIPGELKFAADGFGFYGGLIERDFNKDGLESMSSLTGLKESEISQSQAVGRGIVKAGLTLAGAAPLAAGLAAMEAANMSAQTGDWNSFGATLVETGLGAYDPTGGIASKALVNKTMRGMDWKESVTEAAWSQVSGATGGLSAFVRASVDEDWKNMIQASGRNVWVQATTEAIPGLMGAALATQGINSPDLKTFFKNSFANAKVEMNPLDKSHRAAASSNLRNDTSFVMSGSGVANRVGRASDVLATRSVFGGSANPRNSALGVSPRNKDVLSVKTVGTPAKDPGSFYRGVFAPPQVAEVALGHGGLPEAAVGKSGYIYDSVFKGSSK